MNDEVVEILAKAGLDINSLPWDIEWNLNEDRTAIVFWIVKG